MKISWNHLSHLVDLKNINTQNAANQLTLAGFEVESIEWVENIKDTILTIDITANRQDVIGWAQIAIELSAILNRPLVQSNIIKPIKILRFFNAFSFMQGKEVHACIAKSYIAFDHRHSQLKAYGISNGCKLLDIVDFANLKWGQAIKAYKIPNEIKVRVQDLKICGINSREKDARNEFKIYAEDKELIPIKKEDARHYKKGILRVAFISYQNQNSTQGQPSKSARHNRYCLSAYSEILSMLEPKAIGDKEDWVIYNHHSKYPRKIILLNEKDIHRVLGPSEIKNSNKPLSLNKIVEIMHNLQLKAECSGSNIRVIIPRERFGDIKSKIDIVEEVARIYGFNNFYDTIPKFKKWNQPSKSRRIQQKIRNILRSMGLHEVINYSLRPNKVTSGNLSIINPLSKEQEILRGSIINGILESLEYNAKQGNNSFEVFEIGNIFIKNTDTKEYQESLHLGLLLGNSDFNKSNWQKDSGSMTWLQAKGHTEELFERIHARISWHKKGNKSAFSKNLQKHIHPKNHIHIFNNTKLIGVFSEVNHLIGKNNSNKNYFLEINIEELAEAIQKTEHLQYAYKQYSSYPKITRDLSIKTSVITPMEKIQKAIAEMLKQEERIESVVIASEYYSNRDKKTICLRATYRSKSKTLSSQEIEILDKIFKERMAIFSRVRHKPGSVLGDFRQG